VRQGGARQEQRSALVEQRRIDRRHRALDWPTSHQAARANHFQAFSNVVLPTES
jgi:hypothetical protein